MDKLAEAEVLVDRILEQGFSVNVALSNLNGNADVDWTDCYSRRCKTLKNEYDRKECKAQCQWSSYNVSISRISALRSRCRDSISMEACMRRLQKAIDETRDKQRKAQADIANIRRAKGEAERKQAEKQQNQAVAQPPQ